MYGLGKHTKKPPINDGWFLPPYGDTSPDNAFSRSLSGVSKNSCLAFLFACREDIIDQAIFYCLWSGKIVVTIGVLPDTFDALACVI